MAASFAKLPELEWAAADKRGVLRPPNDRRRGPRGPRPAAVRGAIHGRR